MLFAGLLSPVMAEQPEFEQCIESWIQEGSSQGLSSNTLETVIPGLRHLSEVIVYDRRQPEFTQTFAQYLKKRLTPDRIDQGFALHQQYQPLLKELSTIHGVPGHYLIAFWGLETNFGRHLGKMPILDSLATLACDQRRSEFFTTELFLALRLMERESLQPRQMHGSWAGAMGHTQFMPSSYLRYAIDGDGDGQINLWDSRHDALSSAANFLKQLGWQRDQVWGREVLLPAGFPYQETGLKNQQPAEYWKQLGIRLPSGSEVPESEISAAVLVPAGHQGPAFLVFRNFRVIMKWNNSISYALSVGLLANQIAGLPGMTNSPSLMESSISRRDMKKLQASLNSLGFDAGKPDGLMGPKTRAALRDFQFANGLIADGYPDTKTQKKLLKTAN